MANVNQVFQSAPAGRRVYLAAVFAVIAFSVSIGVDAYSTLPKLRRDAPLSKKIAVTIAPVLTAALGTLYFFRQRARIAQFSIEEDVLVLGKKKYPLSGATEVVRDPSLLKGARRRCGNGGLGAITGSFSSKKLGKFYVFMTGTENAVVVRWPDKAVAVSPADTEFFILCARKAAGLA
jgi:hypothetical protein